MKKSFCWFVVFWVFMFFISTSGVGFAAETYPTKPIKVIAPFGPGGSTDTSCRVFTKYLAKYLGGETAVINVEGAAGTVGSMQVFSAKPDGYTLLFHHLTLLTSYHTGVGKFTWDSLTPIAQLIKFYEVMTTQAEAPWKDVHEFVRAAKQKPGEIKWGVNIGAGLHFAALAFATATDTDYRYVAGGGDADQAKKLLGGHIDVSTPNDVPIRQYVEAGKLRVLGVMANERIPSLPKAPTLKEQGINVTFYFEPSLFGPPGMPQEIVKKIEDAAQKVMSDGEARKELEKIGMYPAYLGQADFKKHLLDLDADLYKFARKGGLIPSPQEKK